MKKVLTSLSLVIAMLLCSCTAGPHQLMRSVDDLDQKLYVKNPVVNGILSYPIAMLLCAARVADTFTFDAYSFWAKDAWDGKGTGFKHYEVTYTDGYAESFLIDDAKLFEVK